VKSEEFLCTRKSTQALLLTNQPTQPSVFNENSDEVYVRIKEEILVCNNRKIERWKKVSVHSQGSKLSAGEVC
jgi:hypothetical protein